MWYLKFIVMFWIGEFLRLRNDVFDNWNILIELNFNVDKFLRFLNVFVKENFGNMLIVKNVNEVNFENDK